MGAPVAALDVVVVVHLRVLARPACPWIFFIVTIIALPPPLVAALVAVPLAATAGP